MSATLTALGLVVLFVLLQIVGAADLPAWAWTVLAAAVASGAAADVVRARR
ncbi:MAG: hypothetical protein FWE71_07615 [Nocardioidaceae bacterium]|nr:hypothetical protein [Nocardioidaceae bacterium]MCL2611855.1 hypothetical protein [Nocardioidaceae bacterium]